MTPEALARREIDHLLHLSGWQVCNVDQVNLHAALGVAIREFPLNTGHGFADYLLYVGGKALRVIKPMHLAYEDPLRILDHGNQWLGRLRHLERMDAMPKSMLLAVTQPPVETDRFAAFEEVRRDLANMGAEFAAANDEQALLRFAQTA